MLFVISFPPVCSQSTPSLPSRNSDAAYSYLATKSLQFYVGWFGDYGWGSVLYARGHFSEKLEISSLWYHRCDWRLLTCFTSAFKYCCRSRGEKLERTNITYGCLAKVIRDGGFTVALIARLSAIPGHCVSFQLLVLCTTSPFLVTTAVFSTCGMGIFVFCLAALLSLPKQFITVYLGVALKQSADGESCVYSEDYFSPSRQARSHLLKTWSSSIASLGSHSSSPFGRCGMSMHRWAKLRLK